MALKKIFSILATIFGMIIFLIYGFYAYIFLSFGADMSLLTTLGLALGGLIIFVLVTPKLRRKLKVNFLKQWLAVLGVYLLSIAILQQWHIQSFQKRIFEFHLKKPIPKAVKIIKGDQGRWLDPETYLIFKTSPAEFNSLRQDYKEIPFEKGQKIFERCQWFNDEPFIKQQTGVRYYQKVIEKVREVNQRKGKGKDKYIKKYHLAWIKDDGKAYFYRQYTYIEPIEQKPKDTLNHNN